MTNKERLIDKFGELLYVVAKADGVIEEKEKEALVRLLEEHEWAAEIKWSFGWAEAHEAKVEQTYKSVIDFCHEYGPAPEYKEFIAAMETISNAAQGVQDSESKIINSFSKDLIDRFQKDLDVIMVR